MPQEELDNTHKIFKDHISKYRPEVDIERVSTGETWLGTDAIKLGMNRITLIFYSDLSSKHCASYQVSAIPFQRAMTTFYNCRRWKAQKYTMSDIIPPIRKKCGRNFFKKTMHAPMALWMLQLTQRVYCRD